MATGTMAAGGVALRSSKAGPSARSVLAEAPTRHPRSVPSSVATPRATNAVTTVAIVGAGYQDKGLVFALPDGGPYHPERFSREFDRRVARHALPRIRLHDLRHTWATLALQSGFDAKIVSERLGLASPVVTLTVYRHVTQPMASDAAERVASVIIGRSK